VPGGEHPVFRFGTTVAFVALTKSGHILVVLEFGWVDDDVAVKQAKFS
jgi:hypothetical protein